MKRSKRILPGILAISLLILALTGCSSAGAADAGKLIADSPRGYLLTAGDIPGGSNFYMPENEAFQIPNQAAILAFGQDKGETLVSEEERVDSWRVHFQASKPDQPGPQVYLATVTQHQSAKGAQSAVEKYNYAALYPDGGWTMQDVKLDLGDKYVVEAGPTEDQQGRKAQNYRIEFSYRNMSVDVLVFGLTDQVKLDQATQAAKAVLLRLKAAPLSSGPILTPTP